MTQKTFSFFPARLSLKRNDEWEFIMAPSSIQLMKTENGWIDLWIDLPNARFKRKNRFLRPYV